jgi:glycyl-tRNA synthetase
LLSGLRAAWDYGPLGVELKRKQCKAPVVEIHDSSRKRCCYGLDSSGDLSSRGLASGHIEHSPIRSSPHVANCYPPVDLRRAFEAKHKHKPGVRWKRSDANCTLVGFGENWVVLLADDRDVAKMKSGLAYPSAETRKRKASLLTENVTRRPSRKKPPFGIGQIGKSFRNEITPGNFIFPHS